MRKLVVGTIGIGASRNRPGGIVVRTVTKPTKVMNRSVPPKKRGKIALRVSMRAGKKANPTRLANGEQNEEVCGEQANDMLTVLSSHPCLHCAKVFNSTGKLQQHMFVHTGERPFKCHECEKGFSSRFKLMRHALIHSNDRRYKCSYCERCFHRKDHLKNHLQVHNPNKKVYKCDQCEKEYNSRLSFRKHIAIHAAEGGDLECKVCGKMFATSEEILYHLKVHSGSRAVKSPNEKKFKCEFCERRFFTRKDVKRHLVVHTGRRDFLCQFCPQRFGRKDHLVRHIKKSHNAPKNKECNDHDLASDYVPYDYIAVQQQQQHTPPVPPPPPSFATTMASTSALLHSQLSSPPPQQAPLPNSHIILHQNHQHHQHRHLDKDAKPFFHPSMTLSAPPPLSYCSPPPSTNPMYLLAQFSSEHANEYKMYEEIKTERDDVLVDRLSPPLDISQLLGFLPYSTTTASQTSVTSPPPLTMTPSGGTQSSSSATMSNSILGSNPVGSSPLPQFNQAFQ